MARFSHRLDWETPHNPLSRLLDEKRAARRPILDLTESNPTRAGIEYPAPHVVAALADARATMYEPTPRGMAEARHAVARYYGERATSVDIDRERLVLSASTSESYSWLLKLLCDPGDAVMVPQPSYPLFDFLAALEGVRLVPYPLAYDAGWQLDLAALQQGLDVEARAIVLVSPNNPTGSFVKRDERARLVELARERDLALIVDEVFADYPFGEDAARVATFVDEKDVLCFSLGGLSKALGLPQMKFGWIHVAGPEPERTGAQSRLELIADTYLSVAGPIQLAAPALLELRPLLHGAIHERVLGNRRALAEAVADSACQVLRAEGGWYAVLRMPATRSDEEWALRLLGDRGVLVQPGYFYDFSVEAHLVVSLLTEPAAFRDGIERIVEAAGEG
jgi:aspartate/methionine/tyrosine aminotransferase